MFDWFYYNSNKVAVILLVLFLGMSGVAFYFYHQKQTIANQISDPKTAADQERKALTERVGKLTALPKDEDPTIVTILDVDKLKKQQFFKQAENGDKALIYYGAKQIYLYRPKTNKIIDMGPIDTTNASSLTQSEKTTVAVYNGTSHEINNEELSSKITAALPEVENIDQQTASSRSYQKTLVITLDNNSEKASKLATALNGTLSLMPDYETKPNATLLVILGEDYFQ